VIEKDVLDLAAQGAVVNLPNEVIEKTAEKYREALTRLSQAD
jgi:phosphoribosylaminoimidazole-succinocarboxamide synthase